MITPEKLAFWIENEYNVLFEGKHGVGKTSMVLSAFEKAGLRYRYYSASTMDPWVDLVGVPKEKVSETGESYLDLVRPKDFQDDSVEAIFLDEFNRSAKKTRNAVMELIQFKSINGKVFKNLKVVWAAINPSDAEYDVEPLDPAQADRFHVKVSIPYQPDFDYFVSKYGMSNARAAIAWWNGLSDKEKNNVSPRRLDYALDVFRKKGDIRDVLPVSSNCSKLSLVLRTGPVFDLLQECIEKESFDKAKEILADENNFAGSIEWILQDESRVASLLHLIPAEKLSALIATNKFVLEHAISTATEEKAYAKVLRDIWYAEQNRRVINRIKAATQKDPKLGEVIFHRSGIKTKKSSDIYFLKDASPAPRSLYSELKHEIRSASMTYRRRQCYTDLINYIPGPDLNESIARDALAVLNELAMASYLKTLENLPHFSGVVNHCVNSIEAAWGRSRREVLAQCSPGLLEKIELSEVLMNEVSF